MDIIRSVDNGIEFFTVQETGESGVSQSGMAILSGVSRQALIKLENNLVASAPSEWLEPWVGKVLTLVTEGARINGKSVGNLRIYRSQFVSAVVKHYAFKNNEVAIYSLATFVDMGLAHWIQNINGWQPQQQQLKPYWYERMQLFNERTRIPRGWFCIFNQIITMVGELESLGYIMPDDARIDASVGRKFCAYLRSLGYDTAEVCWEYDHWYPGYRDAIKANLYPNSLLEVFHNWLEDEYRTRHALEYFKYRKKQYNDVEGLNAVKQWLGLPAGN